MKKLLLILVAVMGFAFAANAQNNAIGLRFGGGSSYGAEVSYQTALGANRLELDLGTNLGTNLNLTNLSFFYLAGVYQWRGPITDWLGWFAGPGVKASYCKNHGVGVALAGQGGVEACFEKIPFLQFSVDVRPEYEFILPKDCINSFNWAAALGVRYKF